jgi:transposase
VRTITPGDVKALQVEIGLAKKRLGLPEAAKVQSCYEAGRDSFWLHRDLVAHEVNNLAVDSAASKSTGAPSGPRRIAWMWARCSKC